MTTDILVRYLHFVSLILLMAAVFCQHLLLKKSMTRAEIGRVQRLDIVYLITAIVVLLTGFAQWLWVGKPAEFYSKNPVFHTKITLFLVVGILSIVPSIFLSKNKKGDPGETVEVPKKIVMFIRLELLLLFLMPLLASLIARGVGIPVVSE